MLCGGHLSELSWAVPLPVLLLPRTDSITHLSGPPGIWVCNSVSDFGNRLFKQRTFLLISLLLLVIIVALTVCSIAVILAMWLSTGQQKEGESTFTTSRPDLWNSLSSPSMRMERKGFQDGRVTQQPRNQSLLRGRNPGEVPNKETPRPVCSPWGLGWYRVLYTTIALQRYRTGPGEIPELKKSFTWLHSSNQ